MTAATRRAMASAAIFFVMGYTKRIAVRRQTEDSFLFTLASLDPESLDDDVLTVVGLRDIILNDPSIVKEDGGSACFSH